MPNSRAFLKIVGALSKTSLVLSRSLARSSSKNENSNGTHNEPDRSEAGNGNEAHGGGAIGASFAGRRNLWPISVAATSGRAVVGRAQADR